MGRLRRARHVQHQRNAGWPNGREPHGHGVSVVVRGGESPLHGEGRQVGRHLKGEGSEMDEYLNRVDVASLESCLTSKESRAVRRGAVGKVPTQVTRRPPTLPPVRSRAGLGVKLPRATRLVICCRGTAAEAMTAMRSMRSQLKLTVNEVKTRTGRVPAESFDFPG